MSRKNLLSLNVFLSLFAFLLVLISFCSPNWLETRHGNGYFRKAGLWVFCFKELRDPKFRYPTLINSCRHVFNEEWWHFRETFMPKFFQTVQAAYTMGFVITCAAFIWTILYLCRCIRPYSWMRTTAFLNLASAICITIAVLIFAGRGDGRDWMPDWRKNYLSWAFAIAVVAAVIQYIVSVLLLISAHHEKKRSGHILIQFPSSNLVKISMFDVRQPSPNNGRLRATSRNGKQVIRDIQPLISDPKPNPPVEHTDV